MPMKPTRIVGEFASMTCGTMVVCGMVIEMVECGIVGEFARFSILVESNCLHGVVTFGLQVGDCWLWSYCLISIAWGGG